MEGHPVGHRLDQCRAVSGAGSGDSLGGHLLHGEEVVAVDLKAGEAVAERTVGEAAGALEFARCRDRPLVVLEKEDDRRAGDPGQVHRLVEVALRGGALADVGHHDAFLFLDLETPGDADRVRELGREGDLRRQHLDVVGDAAGDGVAGEVHEVLLEREAVHQHGRQLAVLGHQPVDLGIEAHRRPDDRGLLTEDRREDSQAALALKGRGPGVEMAADEHPAEAFEDELVIDRRLGAGNQLAFRVE